ncbi:MAG TPA: SDR family oxidoreductase [Acidimicrobiia bacterium]|nr:SDR family oxidoreductase [Acidimicrobiia bacterium]
MPTVLVTGPSSGIGRVTALELGRRGDHVFAAGRSRARIEPVVASIRAAGGSAQFIELDLASMASVREAAARMAESGRALDLVVNNAGVGVNRRGVTEDGFEVHFGINHLGHFLLTRELLPSLSPRARVVSLASAMHFRANGIDFDRMRSPTRLVGLAEYSVSKLANVLFIRELARRHPKLGAYAVHPGLARTPLIPGPIRLLGGRRMLSPEQGADTVLWCATAAEVGNESGHYYQNRVKTPPSAPAQDDDLARELWDRSTAWCG